MKSAALLLVAIGFTVACRSPATPSVGRITYEVSGGFTGWDRVLTVEPDGALTLTAVVGPSPVTGSARVEPAVLRRLDELVIDPAFEQLEPAYLPAPGGADLQDHVVRVEVGGRTIERMSRDGATVPANLREVLGILNGIMAGPPTA
jgi:hypothetical protein